MLFALPLPDRRQTKWTARRQLQLQLHAEQRWTRGHDFSRKIEPPCREIEEGPLTTRPHPSLLIGGVGRQGQFSSAIAPQPNVPDKTDNVVMLFERPLDPKATRPRDLSSPRPRVPPKGESFSPLTADDLRDLFGEKG